MIKKTIKICNTLGLHARASMKLVNLADRFESEILIGFRNRTVNAKSIMNIMILAAPCGAEIDCIITGKDELEAMCAIETLFLERFGEE